MRSKTSLRWWLVLIFMFLFPTIVLADDNLTIEGYDLPKEGDPAEAAKVKLYFDLRQGNNAVTGIQPSNCSIQIGDRTPKIVDAEITEFYKGDHGVGILFIFPKAKAYTEDTFAIRQNLRALIMRIERDVDQLNAVPYDSGAAQLGWSKASSGTLAKLLDEEVKNSDVLEPNLFLSFTHAIGAFESVTNVSKKYLVFISDAEGALVGDVDKAQRLIGNFTDDLRKNKVTPIIIGYSPDGPEAMQNINLLKRIASNGGGVYFQAGDTAEFATKLTRDVYNYIYNRNILTATLDMDGSDYVDAGRVPLQLTVTMEGKDAYKASEKVVWPELAKNRTTLWLSIIGVLVLIGGAIVVIAIKRNRDDEEEEVIEQDPQDVCCATCGKPIPQQLYGFKGEFCLSGGLPDCPYYQMPDRGKIQITRGPLADTTFFIKKDLTTIGSYQENDIYLNDKTVSRKHAAIKTDEGKRYEIRDFGSSNGLYINDERTERKFLRDGDRIKFGTVETVFKLK